MTAELSDLFRILKLELFHLALIFADNLFVVLNLLNHDTDFSIGFPPLVVSQ